MDVTVRRAAEEALRTAEERYRAVVQNTYDLVVLADPSGEIVRVAVLPSRAGLEPSDLIGRDILDRMGPADVEPARPTSRGGRGRPRLAGPVHAPGRDDREVAPEGTGWQPVFDDDGNVKLALGDRPGRDVAGLVGAGARGADREHRPGAGAGAGPDRTTCTTTSAGHDRGRPAIAALANGVEDAETGRGSRRSARRSRTPWRGCGT
jgi:hypothetical protein